MKRVFYVLLLATFVVCCKTTPKDYVSLSGKITHKKGDSLLIYSRANGFSKYLKINADGTFKDTMKIKSGSYRLLHGNEVTPLFLKNGYDLKITLDTDKFDETVKYSGDGKDVNNYLAQKYLSREALEDPSILSLNQADFTKKIDGVENKIIESLTKIKGADSVFVADQKKDSKFFKLQMMGFFSRKKTLSELKGKPSPKFVNYENFKGGKTSLDDLKGKYVYIDIWATWCGPCKGEIPYLKKIEEKYHGKNITFVSVSIDNKKDYDNWKKMIVDKKMGGVQLIADNAWNSKFVKDYSIRGIPRFILLDPEGNIVDADAPRPSSDGLTKLLDGLKI